jgi:molybdenum cofactor guanylyltransferase
MDSTDKNTHDTNTLGVILSGGAGARLDGVDKGLQEYKGLALIEHVIDKLSSQTSDLLICANRNIEHYESFGYRVIKDRDSSSFEGPIAGIIAAIEHIEPNETYVDVIQLLVAPCDAPKLPSNFYARLAAANTPVTLAHDGDRKQNLHCLIKRSHWASLRSFYTNGGRAIHKWYSEVNALEVDFSDQQDCFKNVNRRIDFN